MGVGVEHHGKKQRERQGEGKEVFEKTSQGRRTAESFQRKAPIISSQKRQQQQSQETQQQRQQEERDQ